MPLGNNLGAVQLAAADVAASLKDRVDQALGTIAHDKDAHLFNQAYLNGVHTLPRIPTFATPEIVELRRRAVLNLMSLLVGIPAQISFVDGFRREGEQFPKEWQAWLRNNMASKQTAIYRAALTYGASYVALEELGKGKPKYALLSTKDTIAFYTDPVNDQYPLYVVTVKSHQTKNADGRIVYYDAERTVHFRVPKDGGDRTVIENGDIPHKLGYCPVVRYVCSIDDEGKVRGVIEPAIPVQDRVNQTAFDLLVTQTFSSFKVRWAAGLVGEPLLNEDGSFRLDADGRQQYGPVEVSQSRMLTVDDPASKFGTLDETPLDGFISALEAAIKQFAVIGQLPPHSLLGNMSNLSAETLVAAMAQTMRFGHVLKTTWGASHQSLLRLTAIDMQLGEKAEEDYTSEVRWRDMSDNTLGAVIDGLGKAATMLGIPQRGLWSRVPNTTTQEIKEWEDMADDQRVEEQFAGTDPVAAARRQQPAVAPPRIPTPAEAFGNA
ncbi:hypothetical protein J2X12_002885 [Pseudarthrobacter oxydans]|uniref:Phage portal protein n=1 Tax=Pseudarthrobacter oxydans TaxID=1671 RepID=A0AAW8NC24_PSEOX|nr:phage portal protein [Pseudarthrobacter oxydans]MDR6794378.1 hypothetical protein [Pseudarthrobacter oxydans]MDR7164847.1 hypothetical protein [Pseudarthrobacter oxydans]